MNGEEIVDKACLLLITCFYNFDFIVYCFDTHFSAKKCYILKSVTKKTLPNCPSPNFLATWKSSKKSFLPIYAKVILLFFWAYSALLRDSLFLKA